MRPAFLIVLLNLGLAACVTPPRESAPLLRSQAPTATAKPVSAPWPSARWWQSFGDTQLNALIDDALRSAPGLKTSAARVAAAEAAASLVQARTGLALSASAEASRNRLSSNGLISSDLLGLTWYNQMEAGLQLQRTFDWWGRERAALEASVDRRLAAEAEMAASRLVLITAVSADYVGWQNDSERLAIARETATRFDRAYQLQRLRTEEGLDEPDLLQRLRLEQAQALLAVERLNASREQHRLALAALLGITPDALKLAQRGRARVPAIEAPDDLRLGLIARRPDLVASRWRVEASVQDVAEARAGYYPELRLSALAGLSSLEISDLFDSGSRVASAGVSLYLPIFDLRGVRARHGVRQAQLALAASSYDEAIVAAAQDVGEQLLRCRSLKTQRRQLEDRQRAADHLRATAVTRHLEGMDDARSRIDAELRSLQARDALLQLEGELALARLGLIRSLGGGIDMPAAAVAVKQ